MHEHFVIALTLLSLALAGGAGVGPAAEPPAPQDVVASAATP